jgi:hypothetical protein
MKRDIATAITLKDLNAAGSELFSRSQHIGRLGVASERDHRRVFEQKQDIADLSRLAQINQLLLQANPFAIINLTELDDRNHVAIEIIGPQRSAGILPATRYWSKDITSGTI